MRKCRWCDRTGQWPLVCMNSRDMEDRAIDGDETCFAALAAAGWGEKGERYVRLNKVHTAERRAALARAERDGDNS